MRLPEALSARLFPLTSRHIGQNIEKAVKYRYALPSPSLAKASKARRHIVQQAISKSEVKSGGGVKDENRRSNFWEQTQSILLAAFVSWVAGLSTPLQAEAKRPEPPAPVPTAYDELQNIVSSRSGTSGSLLENFRKAAAAPANGAINTIQSKLSEAPPLIPVETPLPTPQSALKKASDIPEESKAAVEEVQKGADQTIVASSGDASSQPLFLGLVAAIIGFGGFKIFTGQQGEVASKPSKAVRVAKRQVQARLDLQNNAGTKRITKQLSKAAPKPLKQAFQGTKSAGKKPAEKGSGGLFGLGKRSLSKQGVDKKRGGTAKTGTKRVGTSKVGGTRKVGGGTRKVGGGTRKVGGSQPSSKRQSPDEDSSSTIGVAGIVGLGLAVAGFIGLNLSANNTAKDFAKSAAEKANDIPAAISDAGKGNGQDIVANAQKAAPDVRIPEPPTTPPSAFVDEVKQAMDKTSGAVADTANSPTADVSKPSTQDLPSSTDGPQKDAAEGIAEAAKSASESKPETPDLPSPEQTTQEVLEAPKGIADTIKAFFTPAAESPKSEDVPSPQQAVQKAQQGGSEVLGDVAKEAPTLDAAIPEPEDIPSPQEGVEAAQQEASKTIADVAEVAPTPDVPAPKPEDVQEAPRGIADTFKAFFSPNTESSKPMDVPSPQEAVQAAQQGGSEALAEVAKAAPTPDAAIPEPEDIATPQEGAEAAQQEASEAVSDVAEAAQAPDVPGPKPEAAQEAPKGIADTIKAFFAPNAESAEPEDVPSPQQAIQTAEQGGSEAIAEVAKATPAPDEIVPKPEDLPTPQEGVQAAQEGASEATAEIVEGVSSGDEPSSKPENLPSPSEAVEAVQQMAVLRIQDAPEAIEQAAKAAPSIDVPSPENLPSPQQAIETAQQQAPKAIEEATKAAPAALSPDNPDLPSPEEAVETVQEAPKAVEEAAKAAPGFEAIAPKTSDDPLFKPQPGDRAPETSTLKVAAAEEASLQKAGQTALQSSEGPKPSTAFEEAAKKLSTGLSAEKQYTASRSKEDEDLLEATKKQAQKVFGSVNGTESSNVVQAPSIPPQAAEAVQKATKAGSSNSGLVLGGLAAAAVLGIAVAVPKEKAAGTAQDAAASASKAASTALEGAQDQGKQASNEKEVVDTVKGDIASRKQEAQKWISEWRGAAGQGDAGRQASNVTAEPSDANKQASSDKSKTGGMSANTNDDIESRKKEAQDWISEWRKEG